jgi:hypothetical protein
VHCLDFVSVAGLFVREVSGMENTWMNERIKKENIMGFSTERTARVCGAKMISAEPVNLTGNYKHS